jgi:hypothetical protein
MVGMDKCFLIGLLQVDSNSVPMDAVIHSPGRLALALALALVAQGGCSVTAEASIAFPFFKPKT